ncbi:hypothetical protein R9C00_21490 [Flammeovirgaceae bacterium SG7u.111]|nr:hypothetical protein [Flammeovirgaceae bacterium SG7u.132]WPO34276.1 hypothetical protein R9C00_21490 [Flammeovirgaceae bacterium SG7u.111]
MKELFDKRLADKIREELDSLQPEYDPTSWDKFEKKLPTNFVPEPRFPLAKISTIAAMLLFSIVPFQLGDQDGGIVQSEMMSASMLARRGGIEEGFQNEQTAKGLESQQLVEQAATELRSKTSKRVGWVKEKPEVIKNQEAIAYVRKSTFYPQTVLVKNAPSINRTPLFQKVSINLLANSYGNSLQKSDVELLGVENDKKRRLNKKGLKRFVIVPSESQNVNGNFRNPMTLSISTGAFASFNHENQLGYTKPGAEFGMLVNVPVAKKLKVSSGLLLGQYQAKGLANPYKFSAVELNGLVVDDVAFQGKGSPPRKVEMVTKEALMHSIVIPINVSYSIGTVGKFALYGSAGVNSYVNFKEIYEFKEEEFVVPAETNVPDVTLLEFGREHYGMNSIDAFSAINLSVGLERVLKNNNSYVIEPFVRLPLKAIGSESLKFRSAGVSLKYNFVLKK